MFQIRAVYSLGDDWEVVDDLRYLAAGRGSDESAAGKTKDGKYREHTWFVCEFRDAQELKLILETVDGVSVAIRERTSLAGM